MGGMFHPSSLDPEVSGALLEASGSAAFGALFLDAAQRIAAIDEIFGYRMAPLGVPEPLVSSSVRGDAAVRTDGYARRFHRYDPSAAARDALGVGQGIAYQVRTEQIAQRDYRHLCFERPRFAAKSCFAWRDGSHSLVLSFYHRAAEKTFDVDRLGALATIGIAALARRAGCPPLAERIEGRLRRLFPQLSPRERQICARTIAGQTAEEIAVELGLKRSSVITYRQRAYQRYGFVCASDFLDVLLS